LLGREPAFLLAQNPLCHGEYAAKTLQRHPLKREE
jgi:hypothetical protein